jgi:signal recognition particle GTPase
LTVLKADAYERRKKTASMQEACRIRTYIQTKHDKETKMTEKLAENIAKDEARKRYDYINHEVDYRFYSDMLSRLIERKIEVQSINKIQKQVDDGF